MKRLLTILLCVVMVFSSVVTAFAEPEATTNNSKVIAEVTKKVPAGYEKIAENSKLALYFRSNTPAIAVQDKSNNHVWTSAVEPDFYTKEGLNEMWRNNMNSLVSFTYTNFKDNKGNLITVNAVSEKPNVTNEKITNGIRVNYTFPNQGISFSVEITLESDGIRARVPVDSIKETDKFGLTSIELLPFFGASRTDQNGYVFYPDGSGALLHFKESEPVDANKYTWYIFGEDEVSFATYMQYSLTDLKQAMLPVFGVKQGDNAFIAIITEGEADTALNLYPSGYVVNLYRIAPEFTYRRTYEDPRPNQNAKQKQLVRTETNMLMLDHEVKYVFLSGDNANYSGMANTYRDYLLSKNAIKDSIKPDDKIPFGLDLFMGIREQSLFIDKFVAMTTFSQAKEIMETLRGLGIDRQLVNLIGWSKKGYRSYPIIMPPERALGGEKGLRELIEYANQNGDKIYLQTNLDDAYKEYGGFSVRNDTVLARNRLVVTNATQDRFILNPTFIYERFMKIFLPKAKKLGIHGVNFENFGSRIYFDYNLRNPSTREQTSEMWKKIMSESVNEFGGVATQGGNLYVLDTVDRLFNIPVEDSGYFVTDEAIPFYQMIVHGYIPYSANAGNFFHDSNRQKLKWVEYGCIPYFELTYQSANLLKYTDYNRLFTSQYTDWADTAAAYYKEFNERLKDVWDQTMVRHEKVADGVYVVTYSNGTKLYVNYNEHDVTVDGNVVKALDYLVVDKGGNKK